MLRPNRPATTPGDLLAHARRTGRADQRDARVRNQCRADLGTAQHDLAEVSWCADRRGGLIEQCGRCDGSERSEVARLPDHRIAAHHRQRRIPAPHGDREVERRDHTRRSERMPLLHQPVAGTFAGDRQAVQLAAEADGEVADVDHLLHLAKCLALDLADLDLHQTAEVCLVRAQQRGELADQLAAQRARCGAPRLEGGRGLVDRLIDRGRRLDTAEARSGDRAASRVRAGGRQAGCTTGAQRGIGEIGEGGLGRKCHVNHAATCTTAIAIHGGLPAHSHRRDHPAV